MKRWIWVVAALLAAGVAIVLGVLRILTGWPIHLMIAGGYVAVVLLTMVAPEEIIGIAYDSGGVTTSTITVPLVTALGVGLASSIEGRNPVEGQHVGQYARHHLGNRRTTRHLDDRFVPDDLVDRRSLRRVRSGRRSRSGRSA